MKKTQKKTARTAVKSEAKKESKIQPLGDRVLVLIRTGEKETTTASGIIIPTGGDSDKESKRGEIIAVGPGRHEDGRVIPVSVKVGDKVLFQWGDKLVLEETATSNASAAKDEDYYLVRESEILAILR